MAADFYLGDFDYVMLHYGRDAFDSFVFAFGPRADVLYQVII